jgi:hypothetical protein
MNPLERFCLGAAEREMTLTSDSEEVLRKRAEANFRKEERAKDGKKNMSDYEAQGRAVAANTVRLRALRLAKEAAEKIEEVAKKPLKRSRIQSASR